MDRNLQIALVSGALAILWGYGLRERLKRGDTQVQFKWITRRDHPGAFWSLMIVIATVEAAFIGMAVTYLAAWLGMP
jgi:hypothetical protein